MIIEKEKSDCIESLFTGLTKASRWRLKLVDQYTDPRNASAAEKLAKLADETPSLSNEYWEVLKPHFHSSPTRWREALSLASPTGLRLQPTKPSRRAVAMPATL
jgi:hypothetical protein